MSTKKTSINTRQASIYQVIIFFYSFLTFIDAIYRIKYSTVVFFIISIVLTIGIWVAIRNTLQRFDYLVFGYIILFILWSSITQQEVFFTVPRNYRLVTAFIIGISFRHIRFNVWLFRLLHIIFCALILFGVYYLNQLENSSHFFHMNRNLIPVFTIAFSTIVFISDREHHNRTRPVLWPTVLGTFIAFLSMSRLGLAVQLGIFILLLSINIYYLYNNHLNELQFLRKRIFKLIALLAILLITFFAVYIIIQNSRFATRGLSSSGRMNIYISFFQELTMKKIIFGFHPQALARIGSVHNSYLYIVSAVGLFSVPVFLSIVWLLIRLWKYNYQYLIVFCIFLAYSFFENTFFFGRYVDVVYFIFLFYLPHEKPGKLNFFKHISQMKTNSSNSLIVLLLNERGWLPRRSS